jgi:hypothetical protein
LFSELHDIKSIDLGSFAYRRTSVQNLLFIQRLVRWLVVAAYLSAGVAMAQSEPTMAEIYATAQAGNLDEAQKMITHVLISHPNSAKAHFVQSELSARQGNLSKARDALAKAEALAPGLPFAKPEAVQALRSQLSVRSIPTAKNDSTIHSLTKAASPIAPSGSLGLPLMLTGGVIIAGYFIFRWRSPMQPVQQAAYANQNGLTGPQTFGGAASMQPPVAQPLSSGLGGQIMGGVATGLAVGAGVMAAEAIGRNLMGNRAQPLLPQENRLDSDYTASTTNTDMGGQDFGISDDASWDDAGSSGGGGGGDWDT